MGPKDGRQIRVIHEILGLRAYRQDLKHLRRVLAPVASVEPIGAVEQARARVDTLHLCSVARVAREDEQLEARVGREEVLDLVRSAICDAHKHLWEHALADGQVRGVCLVGGGDDGRGGVVDTDAGCECTKGLERPVGCPSLDMGMPRFPGSMWERRMLTL
jgi:hypothetical protein